MLHSPLLYLTNHTQKEPFIVWTFCKSNIQLTINMYHLSNVYYLVLPHPELSTGIKFCENQSVQNIKIMIYIQFSYSDLFQVLQLPILNLL